MKKNIIKEQDLHAQSAFHEIFPKITKGIYFATIATEVVFFFVLQYEGLIYQSLPEYIWCYMLRPILISTIILVAGVIGIRHAKPVDKQVIHLLMVTLMLANMVYVHNVFQVSQVAFCLPIFMTIAYLDRKLLDMVTGFCEFLVVALTVYCLVTHRSVSRSEYYIPSALIVMLILGLCNIMVRFSIEIIENKNRQLMEAMLQAKEAKEQAELANRSKSIFLSNMSHEIRTPITAVLGLDEMILRESTEPQIRGYARNIQSSGKTLLSLINDILDLSKIESGKMELVELEYDVSSMLNDLVNAISPRIYNKGLSFQLEVDHAIPCRLKGDEVRLKQIILNILTNAVKYTDEGSVTMRVKSAVLDEAHIGLNVEVEDTGRGMKPEEMEKLFAPYERLDEQNNHAIEGTGLGMSITHQLLDMMGAGVEVESEYRKGSKISFEVTQEVCDWEELGDYEAKFRQTKNQEVTYHESFVAPDAHILLVDDTPINLMVVCGLLKQTQMQIETASSGKECLNKVAKNHYDVIFIDHMMPEMDGIETLQKMREMKDSPCDGVPVVVLTANAIAGAREQYLEAGFTEYLTKPIEFKKMEQLLIRLLPKELLTVISD